MPQQPLILISNDDSIHAKGLQALIESVRPYGDLLVIAPDQPHSGMSHAITVKHPIRLIKHRCEDGLTSYSCTGTPVDAVKLALNVVAQRKPDFLLSGINHGSNASASVIYSGTMGAAIEGCLNNIPAIGFSLDNWAEDADFSSAKIIVKQVFEEVLQKGLPDYTCLNVNIPDLPYPDIKGLKTCRQTRGKWQEEFLNRQDPGGRTYYWLTGNFVNDEPNAQDTDEWALKHHYVSVVPVCPDMTAHHALPELKQYNWNREPLMQ